MDKVVPGAALLALIAPHYPKMGRHGRQPYPLATMLRVHVLQQWYALSDPAMEEALYDTAVMRQFARLSGLDNVPGETTIRPGNSGRFKASPPRKIAAAAELAHCAIVLCP